MKALLLSLLTAILLINPAAAQETPDESESGLALPRMVSLQIGRASCRERVSS